MGSGHVSFEAPASSQAPGSCSAPEPSLCPGKAAALGLTDPTWINPVGFATVFGNGFKRQLSSCKAFCSLIEHLCAVPF